MGAMGSPEQRSGRPNPDPEVNDLWVNVEANNVEANKELWF